MLKFLKIINSYRLRILNDIKKTGNQVNWRLQNQHNMTSISRNIKDSSLINVGIDSYGTIDVLSFENPGEKLTIGDHVSIAGNVLFILGGNHQIDAFSTYPIKSQFYSKNATADAQTKGAIIVEDEVWIGNNVLILSGITLGYGSIVASGSVVTKDVKPFSIVGGNPAQFIKFRIAEELIKERIEFGLKNIPVKTLSEEELHLLYQPLTASVLDRLKKQYNQ
ncbi:CatB-related O-acetyltransferase [Flavobacterium qiangtangense]|uniref:CatB-related O-acetyltransferase n=1 Tax=Flavobacterium qiangtangense TaxID=1442595 RepID=A0ABW1PSS6_9FLAO